MIQVTVDLPDAHLAAWLACTLPLHGGPANSLGSSRQETAGLSQSCYILAPPTRFGMVFGFCPCLGPAGTAGQGPGDDEHCLRDFTCCPEDPEEAHCQEAEC